MIEQAVRNSCRQLGNIHGNVPRLIVREQLGVAARLILEIDVSKLQPVVIAHAGCSSTAHGGWEEGIQCR
jgi:hypothetical protein